MKILVYNTEELFKEYNEILVRMKNFNSIVQNNMVVSHEETIEFFNLFDKKIEDLKRWKEKVRENFWDNFVSDEKGEELIKELVNNNGKLNEK